MEGGNKICPYCANEIKKEAIKCQYCHEILDKKIKDNVSGFSSQTLNEYKKLSKFGIVGCILLIISFLSGIISSFFLGYSDAVVLGAVLGGLFEILIASVLIIGICKYNRIFGLSLVFFSLFNLIITILKRAYGTLSWTTTTTVRVVWKIFIFIVSVIGVIYVFKYNSALKNTRLSKKEKISIIFLILLFIYLISEIVYHFVNYY